MVNSCPLQIKKKKKIELFHWTVPTEHAPSKAFCTRLRPTMCLILLSTGESNSNESNKENCHKTETWVTYGVAKRKAKAKLVAFTPTRIPSQKKKCTHFMTFHVKTSTFFSKRRPDHLTRTFPQLFSFFVRWKDRPFTQSPEDSREISSLCPGLYKLSSFELIMPSLPQKYIIHRSPSLPTHIQ